MEPAAVRRAPPEDHAALDDHGGPEGHAALDDHATAGERERELARERARKHQQAAARARSRAAARERDAELGATGRSRPEAAELPPDRFLDREESWLRFSQRVLELSEDPNVPLLERVRFSAIFASGMDEFFGVRIAGRVRRMVTGLPVEAASGQSPDKILEDALELARELAVRHARGFSDQLQPALAEEGIEVLRWKELVPDEQARLERLFKERIYPVLTPLAVDPAHPFPFISGLTLSLAMIIADPRTGATDVRPGEGAAAAAALPDSGAEPVRAA